MTDIILDNLRESRNKFQVVLHHLANAGEAAKECGADDTAREIDQVYSHALDVWAKLQERVDDRLRPTFEAAVTALRNAA
jgi:hypothetical protein